MRFAQAFLFWAFQVSVCGDQTALASDRLPKHGFADDAFGSVKVRIVFLVVVALGTRVENVHGLLGPKRGKAKSEELQFARRFIRDDRTLATRANIRPTLIVHGLRGHHIEALFNDSQFRNGYVAAAHSGTLCFEDT